MVPLPPNGAVHVRHAMQGCVLWAVKWGSGFETAPRPQFSATCEGERRALQRWLYEGPTTAHNQRDALWHARENEKRQQHAQ